MGVQGVALVPLQPNEGGGTAGAEAQEGKKVASG